MDAEQSIDELISGAETPAAPPVGAVPIKKVSYTHDGMIDLMIANPAVSQNQLAAHFGYTAAWVSTILASDAFQARLAERREQIIDPAIRASTKERFEALLLRNMEILQEKLSRPSHQIPDNLVIKTLEVSSKALGYGARVEPVLPQTTGVDHLAHLAHRLIDLQSNVRGALNGQAQQVPEDRQVAEVPSPRPASGESNQGTVRADSGEADSTAQADGRRGVAA